MKKWRFLLWFPAACALLMSPLPDSEAREDTAHMSFRKTAVSGKNTQEYVVQKGDSIDRIVQKFMENASHRYSAIKQLNPELKNIHRIYPGQTLIVPVLTPGSEETVSPALARNEKHAPYYVKKGDSLTRILRRQLRMEEADIPKTLKLVRQMNPGLSDLNRISIGQTILLPATGLTISSPTIRPSDKQGNAYQKMEAQRPLLPPEKEMDLLKQLINRSHGALIRRGNYYIPLPQTGRMTIDCSLIPVVEFDDGSAVLLDFADRMPKPLQQMLAANWKNYSVVKVPPSRNIFLLFQEIMNASASYTAKRGLKPLLLEKEPQVLISLDWFITEKNPTAEKPYFHGIFLASDKARLLPEQIRAYAEQKGFQLTEIVNGAIPPSSPSVKHPPALELRSISSDNRMDLIFNLLVKLGYSPLKDQELELLDNTGNGFHFSVKPDILLKTDQREILVFSKKLPKYLIEALSRQKKEVQVIDARVSKQTALSQTLSALRLPSSVGRYAFYIGEKGHKAKITITLSAVKIDRKESPLYLIDYGLDSNLYTLLHRDFNAEIVRY